MRVGDGFDLRVLLIQWSLILSEAIFSWINLIGTAIWCCCCCVSFKRANALFTVNVNLEQDGIGSRMASGFFGCCEGAGDLTVGGVKSDSWIVDQDEDTLEKGDIIIGECLWHGHYQQLCMA